LDCTISLSIEYVMSHTERYELLTTLRLGRGRRTMRRIECQTALAVLPDRRGRDQAITKFYSWRSMMRKSVCVLSPCGWNPSELRHPEQGSAYEPARLIDDQPVVALEFDQRWSHITKALSGERAHAETPPKSTRRRSCAVSPEQEARIAGSPNACVKVLDHSTPFRAFISWHDSTSCCYGYQLWRRSTSRRTGVCALSGVVIHRGDEIFQPITREVRPGNATAMILAAYIDRPEFSA
jgi:hypothetical protein